MEVKKIENILERKLNQAEIERFQRIESLLGIKDNDALWTIIIALEYQRDYYQALPEKIQKIVDEVQIKSVLGNLIQEPLPTSYKIIFSTFSLFFMLLLGAFCLCLGYKLGGKSIPFPAAIFAMPVGYVLAATLIVPGLLLIILASKDWAEKKPKKAYTKGGLAALTFVSLGWIFATL